MRPTTGLGVLFALLALLLQISAGMAVPQRPVADVFADAVAATICRADTGQTDPGPSRLHQHMPDCAVCPACQALHLAPLVPAPPPWIGGSRRVVAIRLPPGEAVLPPRRWSAAATARGPPATV
jgi:hypothetical protein